MLKKDCYLLGNITKTRGFKGELVLFLDVTNPFEYELLESVYVEISGILTPFFIEQIRIQNNNRALIHFEQVGADEAEKLVGKFVFLPLTNLPELSETEFYDHEIPGFEAVDSEFGPIGKVIQVIDLPSNPLLQIDKNGTEILIPLRNGTVQKVDRVNKHLLIQSPPGLIELYVNRDFSED